MSVFLVLSGTSCFLFGIGVAVAGVPAHRVMAPWIIAASFVGLVAGLFLWNFLEIAEGVKLHSDELLTVQEIGSSLNQQQETLANRAVLSVRSRHQRMHGD
jgi:hypothetical protein